MQWVKWKNLWINSNIVVTWSSLPLSLEYFTQDPLWCSFNKTSSEQGKAETYFSVWLSSRLRWCLFGANVLRTVIDTDHLKFNCYLFLLALQLTTYTALMDVSTGLLEAYLRDCPDPCSPWWSSLWPIWSQSSFSLGQIMDQCFG